MEEGLLRFVEGKIRRISHLSMADLSIRKLAAIEALSRFGKAEPKHRAASSARPRPPGVLDWWSILRREDV
jgi:hypothetical protein